MDLVAVACPLAHAARLPFGGRWLRRPSTMTSCCKPGIRLHQSAPGRLGALEQTLRVEQPPSQDLATIDGRGLRRAHERTAAQCHHFARCVLTGTTRTAPAYRSRVAGRPPHRRGGSGGRGGSGDRDRELARADGAFGSFVAAFPRPSHRTRKDAGGWECRASSARPSASKRARTSRTTEVATITGSGMNSSDRLRQFHAAARQSALAFSIRSLDEDTKFQSMKRGRRPRPRAASATPAFARMLPALRTEHTLSPGRSVLRPPPPHR